MEAVLLRTNGGKGRINNIKLYDKNRLVYNIVISKVDEVEVYKM